jgi:hypothetical protein
LNVIHVAGGYRVHFHLAASESQLSGMMWYKDTPGQQDKRTTDSKRFTSRKQLTALSKSVQMMGKLHFHESKSVSTSSHFNFQIHVVE